MAKRRGGDPGRAYARLTLAERMSIERGLDRGESMRSMASALGRAATTVANEVRRNRTVAAPRERAGERCPRELPEGACPLLLASPWVCNACRKRRCGCSRRPKVEYSAKRAQALADEELSASRRGVDETEESMAWKLGVIRSALARGLSPEQIAAARPELGESKSTIYRWIDAGYGGMSNMDLRRKVGYKPRKRSKPRREPRDPSRSWEAFCALAEEQRASRWGMDTVQGLASDSQRLLTLLHRPTRLQLALLVASGECASVLSALSSLGTALGAGRSRRLFGLVLTDNGSEFSDAGALAGALGEPAGETRLYFCQPMRSDQKGACERNHVEIRKLLPKGAGVSFDRLVPADCRVLMSQVNSEPRPSLAGLTPIAMFRAAYGADADALLDALGVEQLPYGRLDLTPGAIDGARALRGEPPLAG